jgi:esterase
MVRCFILAALACLPAAAQLAPPNDAGVTLGHIHLAVKDVDAQRHFFIDMLGGTAVRNGPLDLIQFPGVYIMLRKSDPTGPPAGSIVDHFGFAWKDLPAALAKWKANNLEIEQTTNPNQGYVHGPDGLRVEFFGNPSLPVPVQMNHIHFYLTETAPIQAWYAKTFGGTPGKRARVATPGWIECDYLPGGINLSFSPQETSRAPTKGRSLDHIGFEVKNIDQFAKNLEAQGIKLEAPIRQIPNSKTKVAFLTDPWGTYIEITEGLAPNPLPHDRYIAVNGLRLHYLDWGSEDKPPFIMLHGISRVAHQFDHLAPHFDADYHVMALDMRGHGDSAWSPEGAYLVEDYVKDLEAFADELNLRGLTLLGNSTGGRVVQVYAGLHPDRVRRLIAEDVGPERTNDIASAFTRQVQQEVNGWANEAELVASLKKSNPRTPDQILNAYAHFGSKPRPDGRIEWKRDPNLAKGFVPTELWRFVDQIKCPTIYILGGASRIVPAETQQKLMKTLPDVKIVVMPGLGHYPDQEATEEFIRIVKSFLA